MTPQQQALLNLLNQVSPPVQTGTVSAPMPQMAVAVNYVSREDIDTLVASIAALKSANDAQIVKVATVVYALQGRIAQIEQAINGLNKAFVELVTQMAEPLQEVENATTVS